METGIGFGWMVHSARVQALPYSFLVRFLTLVYLTQVVAHSFSNPRQHRKSRFSSFTQSQSMESIPHLFMISQNNFDKIC